MNDVISWAAFKILYNVVCAKYISFPVTVRHCECFALERHLLALDNINLGAPKIIVSVVVYFDISLYFLMFLSISLSILI